MKIVNNTNNEKWNDFVGMQNQSQFLQSWEWGELAEREGVKVFRIGAEENGTMIGAASLMKKSIFGFNYFFCPRGPIVSLKVSASGGESYKVIKFLFDEIKKIAEQEGIIFLRFEPSLEIGNWKLEIKRTIDIEPSKTTIIDLNKTEEELLNAMHQKTRYNIRLAEKKGVVVREGRAEDFNDFWRIMKETVERDGFRLHSKEHYQQMLELDKNFVKLFLAEYKGKIIAAVLASFFGDMITYVHGASANEDRNVMAPYLLHWQIIKLGKSSSYKYYDLNGIDEQKWPGVTRFKLGFGGAVVNYPGTFDLVFNKTWYNIYKVLRFFRRMI